MPWELTRPFGLALLGLLAPLLLLYILRVQRERRIVPSTWLWQAALRDLAAQQPFRRLTLNLPLILEALAVLALALALAGPVAHTDRLRGSRLVLVIDVSASMATEEDGRTRLREGLGAARDLLGRLEPGAEVMIVAAGREPELVSPFERDRARLEMALNRVVVREVEGQLGRAVAMAADQVRQRGGGRIVLITDGAVADRDALVSPAIPLELIQVGSVRDNTAIVRTEITRTRDPVTHRDRVEVFALVLNSAQKARDLFVTLSARNIVQPLASRRLSLAPGERSPVVLSFDAAPGDAGLGLIVELSPHDALPSDDRAMVRVPAQTKVPVVLAPKTGATWLARAIAADPEVELFRADLGALTPAIVPSDALLVVDGACPERLAGTDVLIVNPGPGACRTVQVGAVIERPPITSWSDNDPRLRFLSLEGVEIARSRSLTVEAQREALVQSRETALIADASSPGRMATVVGFDVGESNWPLRASFVLFMRNVLDLSRAHRAAGVATRAHSGEPVSLRVPVDVQSVDLEYPGGRREQVRAHDGIALAPAATNLGFLYATWKGARPGSSLLPVNLTSEAESQIAPQKLSLGNPAQAKQGQLESIAAFDWIWSALALALIVADLVWTTRGNPIRGGSAAGSPRGRTGERARS